MTNAQKRAHARNGTTPAPARNKNVESFSARKLASKNVISPFIIRGKIVANTSVSFDATYLAADQRKFVEDCEKVINTKQIPHLPTGKTFNEQDSVAVVMYNGPTDFAATLLIGAKGTSDSAYEELENIFLTLQSDVHVQPVKSGQFIPLAKSSQHLHPNIKDANHVKANNDWFAAAFNWLKDNGIMESPDNSYPTCRKDESRNGWVVA